MQDFLNKLESELSYLNKNIDQNLTEIKDKSKLLKDYTKIQNYSLNVIEDKLQKIKERIEPLVNNLLELVFTDFNLKFTFETDIKYGKKVYIPKIVDKDSGVDGGVEDMGGGVLVLTSVILKMIFIMLEEKQPRLLVLDESLNPLSPKYREKASEFISKIAEELNFDILLITFDEEGLLSSYAENIYEVERDGRSETKIRKIK